jgi:hypothetical protein
MGDESTTQPGCVFVTVVRIGSCRGRLCWRGLRWLLELLTTTTDMESDGAYHRGRCYMETQPRGRYIMGLKTGRMLGDGRAVYSSHNFEFG